MEPGADALPVDASVDFAAEIDQCGRQVNDSLKVLEQQFDGRNIQNVGQFQISQIAFRRDDAIELTPDPLVALPQFSRTLLQLTLGLSAFSDVNIREDGPPDSS
jgi:hypothetical protein